MNPPDNNGLLDEICDPLEILEKDIPYLDFIMGVSVLFNETISSIDCVNLNLFHHFQ